MRKQSNVARAMCLGGLAFVLGALGARPVTAQGDAEDRTVEAMCQAGLTTSAIEYVIARRSLVAADPSQSARWTMRLMECHASAALSSRSQAAMHWEACAQVLREFIAADPDNARLPWLQWQSSRCDLLRAQADVALYLAAPANTQPREHALELVRKLLVDLEALETEVKRLQPLAARQGLNGGGLAPAEQLAKLIVDVGLLRCEALLLRTRLYSSGSADRIAAATDVDGQATEILARTEPDWPSRPQLQVAQATARLDLGQSAEALRALEQLAARANSRQARIRAATIAIEYLASEPRDQSASMSGSLSRGAELLIQLQRNEAGPETELAAIQLALASARHKSGEPKELALAELIAKSKHLGATYGDYWRSRAESLLVDSAASPANNGASSVAVDLLIAEVRQLLAAGNATEASAKLLRFRDNEMAAGRGAVALKVAGQAAALLQRQQAWLPAAEALIDVSRRFVDVPGASEAHLQAVFSVSQAVRSDSANAALGLRYEQLLRDQLTVWPNSPTSDEAQGWLASWLMAAGRRPELAAAYLQRAAATTDRELAEQALLNWLGEVLVLADTAASTRQIEACAAARAAQDFRHVSAPAELAELVVTMVTTWPTAAVQTEQLRRLSALENKLESSPWKELGQALRWLSAVRDRQRFDALSQELLDWEPSPLPATVREGLARALVTAIDETPLAEHAQWATRLKLDDSWQTQLLASVSSRSRAVGYRLMAWRGEVSAALDGLKGLAEQAGRSGGALQLELANALADSGPNRWEDSSQVAKVIIAHSPAGSELHWAARWRWLKNQIMSGQETQAQQAAQLLLATQPPESEIWRQRFSQIAK